MRNTGILEGKTKWKAELSATGGRESTEKAQRRRNKRGIGRKDASNTVEKGRDGCVLNSTRREKTEREGTGREDSDERVERELKQKGRETLSVRPSVRRSAGARISHLHRNKLAGTIGSSVHSEHCKHGATVFSRTNRKPLQYAPLTLSTRRGPIIDPTLSFVCTIISYPVTFS